MCFFFIKVEDSPKKELPKVVDKAVGSIRVHRGSGHDSFSITAVRSERSDSL